PSRRRLFTIVIDDLTISPSDAPRARDSAKRLVTAIPSGDLVALVFCGHQAGAQEFTTDRARVIKALEHLDGRRPDSDETTGAPEESANARRAFSTLMNVTEWLAPLEGQRKAVLFLSTTSRLSMAQAFVGSGTLGDDFRRLTNHAMRSNVAIYT